MFGLITQCAPSSKRQAQTTAVKETKVYAIHPGSIELKGCLEKKPKVTSDK